MKMKIKKDDNVVVVAGKDRGAKGKVTRVFPREGTLIVEDVNTVKRHVRRSQSARNSETESQKGEIVERDMPIHASNVMLLDPKTGKPTRVGFSRNEKGDRVRIAKKSGETLS